MLFPFGQELLESEKSPCSLLCLFAFITYKCLLSVLCWSWDKGSAWKTDRSLVGQQEVGMPAKQPKCFSIDTQSTLDTGGQPVSGHFAT